MKRAFAGTCLVLTLYAGMRTRANDAVTDPGPRLGHCLVYDERLREVVLLGGYQMPNKPDLEELWTWNGTRWARRSGTGPAARSLAGAAFDSRRKRLVFFGGFGNKATFDDVKADTWEWDGAWRHGADADSGSRDHHVMAYDAALGKVLRYGGQLRNRDWDEATWFWNGERWLDASVTGPGPRAHFAMVSDTRRKRIVLFGGFGKDGKYRNDTWEWDGAAWRQVSQSGPPPRARHRMAFDSRAGLVILFGGDGVKPDSEPGFRVLGDTWTWDGRHWTEIHTIGPPSRFMHAMAYDAGRNRTVLFGGGDGRGGLDDTWEWDGRGWRLGPRQGAGARE